MSKVDLESTKIMYCIFYEFYPFLLKGIVCDFPSKIYNKRFSSEHFMYSYIFSNNNMEIRVFIIDQIEFMAKIKINWFSISKYLFNNNNRLLASTFKYCT